MNSSAGQRRDRGPPGGVDRTPWEGDLAGKRAGLCRTTGPVLKLHVLKHSTATKAKNISLAVSLLLPCKNRDTARATMVESQATPGTKAHRHPRRKYWWVEGGFRNPSPRPPAVTVVTIMTFAAVNGPLAPRWRLCQALMPQDKNARPRGCGVCEGVQACWVWGGAAAPFRVVRGPCF